MIDASIIITSYNYERFLRHTIDSALNQSHPNTEVIVVDDGSTDNSRGVIASYGGRIVPILKANGGIGSAYNAAYAVSHGRVVFLLDSDDMLLPKAVENALPLFDDELPPPHRLPPTRVDPRSPLQLDLTSGEISTARWRVSAPMRRTVGVATM